ncbi:flagellar biosynthesis protein FlhB [Motiliproteus sp. MSK22-1]|uniref:flagellar biosynthesis protein FlhB n=1 Tax=Motiliproteus sp. MSK22-1 TaxID=1897630 RepID=UPI00097873B2|nr:flagellar biosynthesis protein FlhB [Motiliproteus sp. MSK22-1]OMH30046.1 flagellar biosynthesis protein FlhB [Motiliproteus sp. MSK22-1]
MAEEETGQEKSEEPTSKRLEDARKKGDIARSRELNTTVLLLAAAGGLLIFGAQISGDVAQMMKYNLSVSREAIFDPMLMFQYLGHSIMSMLHSLSLFFVVLIVAALVGPIALGGWNFSSESIMPKFSRLNPLEGIKRMFSLKSLIELLKGIGKFLVVGGLSVVILLLQQDDLIGMGSEPIIPAMEHAMQVLGWAFLWMCATMIFITAIDVPFQLYDYSKKLKMTLQEVKDEMKNTEGKPEVKGRIRQLQREMSQRRMMGEVPEADVVITNPTHYSVALKYNQVGGAAPVLVAKGVDFMALKIREVAVQHEVPILSAPPLARAIYYNTELEEEIPEGLYVAVAQILAHVYQMQSTRREYGPIEDVPDDYPIPDDLQHD